MAINSIGVHIKVKDFDRSKNFYQALGFTQVFAYGPDEEVREEYRGIVFEQGGAKLEIAEGHRAVKREVFESRMENSKVSLMIGVDSLVPVIELCEANGIEIAVGPRHYYWGTLELVVKDPDGVVLVFIASYSETEAKVVRADETWGDATHFE